MKATTFEMFLLLFDALQKETKFHMKNSLKYFYNEKISDQLYFSFVYYLSYTYINILFTSTQSIYFHIQNL